MRRDCCVACSFDHQPNLLSFVCSTLCVHVPRSTQQEAIKREEEEQLVAAQRRQQHADEVRRQVRQREQERVDTRKAFFEEGIKLDQEASER